jgi:RNA polymerase sigma-70 factor (ECF subfamily)
LLRAIFDAELDWVCRTLRRLGVADRDLEDAAQETFLAVHGKLDGFDPDRPVRPWLFAFAFRVAANHRRKRVAVPTEGLDDLATEVASPEEHAAEAEAKTLALRVLDRMALERRDVFVMHEFEGLGAPEIARLLSIPVNTVYSRLRTARAEFETIAARLVERRAQSRSGR